MRRQEVRGTGQRRVAVVEHAIHVQQKGVDWGFGGHEAALVMADRYAEKQAKGSVEPITQFYKASTGERTGGTPGRSSTCVQIIVVETSLWPSSSCTVRMS